MALYKVVFLRSVIKKDLPKLPKTDAKRLMARAEALGADPRPAAAKRLSGREEYRLRQGNYRMLYVIADEILIVEITKIAHRREVYDQ